MLLANKEEFSAIVLYRKKIIQEIYRNFFPAHLTYACSHRIIARKKFLFSSSSKMVQGKKNSREQIRRQDSVCRQGSTHTYQKMSDSTTERSLLIRFTTTMLRKKPVRFCLRIKAGKLKKDVAY